MSDNVPAWVLRMENATDVGAHADCQTGYRCSGFEANAVAKEWRDNQAEIARLNGILDCVRVTERLQAEEDYFNADSRTNS